MLYSDFIRSYSGIRGTLDRFTPEDVFNYARAYADFFANNGTVAVFRDTRPADDHLSAVIGGLIRGGLDVVYCGIAPTPTAQLYIHDHPTLTGGIVITASHNPWNENEKWIGMKPLGVLCRARGAIFDKSHCESLFSIADSGQYRDVNAGEQLSLDKLGLPDPVQHHIDYVLDILRKLHPNPEAVGHFGFRVAYDPTNGASYELTPRLLEALGCEHRGIHTEPAHILGRFEQNDLEPSDRTLGELGKFVKEQGTDIGLKQDPDADRLAVVPETGEAVTEEYTLALAAKCVFSRINGYGPLVINTSTSNFSRYAAGLHGRETFYAPVGEIAVLTSAIERGSVFAGEGNGGVMYFPNGQVRTPGRSSPEGIGLILTLMHTEGKRLSELMSEFPPYRIIKTTIKRLAGHYFDTDGCGELTEFLCGLGEPEEVISMGGVRVNFNDYSWAEVRNSGTKNHARAYTEALTTERAQELADACIEKFGRFENESH